MSLYVEGLIKSIHKNFQSLKVYCQNSKLHKDTFLKHIENDKPNKQKTLTNKKAKFTAAGNIVKVIPNRTSACKRIQVIQSMLSN